MNDAVLPYLRCPNCSSPLAADGGNPGPRRLRCVRGHSFDIAKQGYATLTAGRSPHAGDSTEMITDRATFLGAGHYAFIAGAVASAADADGLVLDAGTGTGYYLAGVLDRRPATIGLGLDVSKPALRRAARAHPRASAALADLWRPLPLADASTAVILDVFAPRNGAEFRRILRPDGVLVVVTPAADHLIELVEDFDLIHVDPDKADRVDDRLGGEFAVAARSTLRSEMHLSADEVRILIGMTPSARHIAVDALTTGRRSVTAAVDLTVYRPSVRPTDRLLPNRAAGRGTDR
jgi:23S rRNA (guanine745-N1)-methyltransferase